MKMNVKLLVTLSVLFAVIASRSAAENELNSVEENVMEIPKSSRGLNRRDLQSFQTQLSKAVSFNLANTSVCPTIPCIGQLDSGLCSAFTSPDLGSMTTILKSLTNCYVEGFCGTDLVTRTVNDVNVPLPAPGNYDGKCYLYGPEVNFTFSLTSLAPFYLGPITTSYLAIQAIKYVVTGLSVRCEPCPPSPMPTYAPATMTTHVHTTTCKGRPPTAAPAPVTSGASNDNNQQGSGQQMASNCCGCDLVTQLLCLVQNLLYSLSLRIPLVNCDCNCPGNSLFGKRELSESVGQAAAEREPRQAAAESPAFDSPIIGVTLAMTFHATYAFRSGYEPYTNDASPRVTTTVSLGPEVPSDYEADLISGIKGVFNDYEIFYFLIFYFNNIVKDLVLAFYTTCTKA